MKDWLTDAEQANLPRNEKQARLHAWALAFAFGALFLVGLRELLSW